MVIPSWKRPIWVWEVGAKILRRLYQEIKNPPKWIFKIDWIKV
jgi:hypothetical protein